MTEATTAIQPALFCEFADDDHLVARVKEFVHTGKIRGRDAALVAEVSRWILAGVSVSRVAAKFGISRNTVGALMRIAESSGKLEQEKARLAAGFIDIAMLCSENFRAKLLANEVPAQCLMVGAGIAADKAMSLTGQASVVIEHKRTGLDEERANVWLERLRAMRDQVIDVSSEPATDSSSVPPTPQLTDGTSSSSILPPVIADLDTRGALAEPPALPITATASTPPPPPPPGGGVAPAPAAREVDPLPAPEFSTKTDSGGAQ